MGKIQKIYPQLLKHFEMLEKMKTPKNPRNLNHSCRHPHSLGFYGDKTPKIPKIYIIPVPEISPKFFWGFSGMKPQKTPKLN